MAHIKSKDPETDDGEGAATPDTPIPAETEAEDDIEIEPEAEVIVAAVGLDDDDDDEDDDEEDAVAAAPVEARPAVVVRPSVRPQPGRPPSAKDEPPPPFDIGEKISLTQNTRPRTGTQIGKYPVGATGRVETVLSQTAIIRFDSSPDTKEVVAFTCLKTLEPEREKARVKAAKEKAEAKEEEAREAEAAKQAEA